MSDKCTTVVLEKVRALSGVAPRVHPDENTMCWQVESTEAGS